MCGLRLTNVENSESAFTKIFYVVEFNIKVVWPNWN